MSSPHELTQPEREFLKLYQQPVASHRRRAIRLSIQYAVGAGVFLVLAIVMHQPLYAIVTYAVFIAFIAIRLGALSARDFTMPEILAKYDARIAELQQQVADLQSQIESKKKI